MSMTGSLDPTSNLFSTVVEYTRLGNVAQHHKSEVVRRSLIEAAVSLLAQEGMRGLTHRKIEESAGVSQGTVKYHFGTLDGIVQAVLKYMVRVESANVMQVSAAVIRKAQEEGAIPAELWAEASQTYSALMQQPEYSLARFELVLHVARHPELQTIMREARDEVVRTTAESLPGANPEASARMVLALMDGILLHQLSAREPLVDTMAPAYMLASAGVALQLPDPR